MVYTIVTLWEVVCHIYFVCLNKQLRITQPISFKNDDDCSSWHLRAYHGKDDVPLSYPFCFRIVQF